MECVVAIGEVKSDLDKTKLKESLIKLKNNKMLRNYIPTDNPFIYRENGGVEYNPKDNFRDQIITFLICNKFDFDYKNLVNEMDEIYDNCECYLRHNLILSISDGTLMYKNKETRKFMFYPFMNGSKLINSFLQPFTTEKIEYIDGIRTNRYEHIVGFLNYMYMGTSMTSILYPEITNYLGTMRVNRSIDENEES